MQPVEDDKMRVAFVGGGIDHIPPSTLTTATGEEIPVAAANQMPGGHKQQVVVVLSGSTAMRARVAALIREELARHDVGPVEVLLTGIADTEAIPIAAYEAKLTKNSLHMLGPPSIRELVAAHHTAAAAEAAAVRECNWREDQDAIEAMEKYNRDTNGVFVIRTPPTVPPIPVVVDIDAKAKWKPPANVRGDTRKRKPWER